VLANDVDGGDVMQLTLAATSIFGKEEGDDKRPLQAYARYLAAQNISPEMVVTRLKFDTNAAVPKLFFQPARWLDDVEYASALEKGQTEEAKRAVTMTVAQADGVDSEVPAQEISKVEAPREEPKVPDQETSKVEAVEEPTKRATKKEEAPAPKKDLNKILEEWDD
jgi:hypothetical protein